MSTKSKEIHVRAKQEEVLLWLEWNLLDDEFVRDVEIADLPESKQAWEELESAENTSISVVSGTDAEGWTMLWGSYFDSLWDPERVRTLSEYTDTCAIYGDQHDGVGSWQWFLYRSGTLHGHYSSFQANGKHWFETGQGSRPAEALFVDEAFASLGRVYQHWSFSFCGTEWKNSEDKLCIVRFFK
jgi:hypothetical protein